MKTIKYLAILALSALMSACTLDIEKTSLGNAADFTAPVLNAMSDIVSDANTSGVEQVTFTWSSADFGANAQLQYSLYAKIGDKTALLGQSFTNYVSLAKGDVVGVLCNDLEAEKNTTVAVESYVEVNVYRSESTKPVISNKISYNVYTYLPSKKNIWLPGAYQGWNQFGTEVWEYAAGTSQYKCLVNVSDGGEGPFYFKVVDESGAWVGMNDGYQADGWEVVDAADKDGNFSVSAEESMLYLTIDTKKKTVARELISKVGLIGGFNGWDESTEPDFTYNATDNVWESPAIDFDGSSGWLVRLNKNWDYKYGGAAASDEVSGGFAIVQGGSDIPSPSAGKYVVRLHANRTPFVIEYVKQ